MEQSERLKGPGRDFELPEPANVNLSAATNAGPQVTDLEMSDLALTGLALTGLAFTGRGQKRQRLDADPYPNYWYGLAV